VKILPRPRSRWLAAVAAGLCLAACGGDDAPPTGPPPPDTEPPVVEIVFPVILENQYGADSTHYDETANGFLDLRATWSDVGSGVDPSTLEVRVIGRVAGGTQGEDLSPWWTRHESTASGMRYEETLERLVRQGSPTLVVSVADSAGNAGTDTLTIEVNYGDYHRSVSLDDPVFLPGTPTGDLTVCEDDQRLYVLRGYAVVVLDANTIERVGVFPKQLPETPGRLLCIPGDSILYATVGVERFDRTNLVWYERIPGTVGTDVLAWSRLDPDIIWYGEWGSGVPKRVDRTIPEGIGGVGFPYSSYWDEYTDGLAVLAGDRKIYWTRFWEASLLVGDPSTGEILAELPIGLSTNLAVSHDDRHVYAPVYGGPLMGLVEIDTETDEISRTMDTFFPPYAVGEGFDVAVNPSGDRLWLTTQDIGPFDPSADPVASLLIDPIHWRKLQAFPRPVPPGTRTRWVQAATFHPHGKLLYQARDDDIDVYIIR
jgi:hypothetical protein